MFAYTLKQLKPALLMLVVLTLVTGAAYPAFIAGAGQVLFPVQAGGVLGPLALRLVISRLPRRDPLLLNALVLRRALFGVGRGRRCIHAPAYRLAPAACRRGWFRRRPIRLISRS